MIETTDAWKRHYSPPEPLIWQGRSDSPLPERFHQSIKFADLSKQDPLPQNKKVFAFLGFQSDEGVKRNKGRPGAIEGPAAIRKALAPLPFSPKEDVSIVDVGNICCKDEDLEEAQKQLGKTVKGLYRAKTIPILFGGGHEISWGHYQGIEESFPQKNLTIINFDAHFDLRPLEDNGKGNSGTSFSQIARARNLQGLVFDYYCLGIQKTGNTASLFNEARKLDVKTVLAEDFFLDTNIPPKEVISRAILKNPSIYLTVCMDVFSASVSPGVSAPQPLGLTPWQVIPLLRSLARCGRVLGLDFAELAPCLDHEGKTARLAAILISEFLEHFQL